MHRSSRRILVNMVAIVQQDIMCFLKILVSRNCLVIHQERYFYVKIHILLEHFITTCLQRVNSSFVRSVALYLVVNLFRLAFFITAPGKRHARRKCQYSAHQIFDGRPAAVCLKLRKSPSTGQNRKFLQDFSLNCLHSSRFCAILLGR